MCINCAFSNADKPRNEIECQICTRNPVNSGKFVRRSYKSFTIRLPVDMFISKEHMVFILQELREQYFQGRAESRILPKPVIIPKEPDEREWNPWYPRYTWTMWSSTSKDAYERSYSQ